MPDSLEPVMISPSLPEGSVLWDTSPWVRQTTGTGFSQEVFDVPGTNGAGSMDVPARGRRFRSALSDLGCPLLQRRPATGERS